MTIISFSTCTLLTCLCLTSGKNKGERCLDAVGKMCVQTGLVNQLAPCVSRCMWSTAVLPGHKVLTH